MWRKKSEELQSLDEYLNLQIHLIRMNLINIGLDRSQDL